MSFWNNLEPRERLLLGGAATLFIIIGVFLLGIRPILSAKANATDSHNTAMRQLETLQAKLPAITQNAQSNRGTQAFNRNAVLQTVRGRSLDLSRIEPVGEGGLKIWFDEATSVQVFGFLNDLTSTYAAKVTSVQMSRKANGLISATLTIQSTGA